MSNIIKTQEEVTENPVKAINNNLIDRKALIQYILQMDDVSLSPKALNRVLEVISNFPAAEVNNA